MTTSRTIRLFVSSTFSDLKAERNALQEKVFPRLKQLCLSKGLRFQRYSGFNRKGWRKLQLADSQELAPRREKELANRRSRPLSHLSAAPSPTRASAWPSSRRCVPWAMRPT